MDLQETPPKKFLNKTYAEKYKILMNRFKEDLSKWRKISWSWIGEYNVVKVITLANLVYLVQSQSKSKQHIL